MTDRCCRCELTAVRQVLAFGYCLPHLRALYATFEHVGVGLPVGDDDLLQCCRCNATWHGPFGDICWWCERSREAWIEQQAALVLVPPDLHIDLNDQERRQALKAWAHRLRNAVDAGIIDQQQARRALENAS